VVDLSRKSKPVVKVRCAGAVEKEYDLSRLNMHDLIELAYNLGDVIDEMVADLEDQKSKTASALDLVRAVVAQVRLLTEPSQQ